MRVPWAKSRLFKCLAIIFAVLCILLVGFGIALVVKPPLTDQVYVENLSRSKLKADFYTCEDSWLKKNRYGLWEMYLEGDDFELGVKNGILAEELIHSQEEAFIAKIKEMIPSEFYLNFLKYVVAGMNRNLDHYIAEEYLREIYGVSLKASEDFRYIGPAYQRMLNYHAAHDIGHALQNMNLVACTAFSVNGDRSKDGGLLVGRNLDFSMGEDFARDVIVAFYNPDHGHSFVSITWGGMIGVVSGMNIHGLTVTLNAAKSGIPTSARTPTSILARQILQYASTIEEAYALADQTEVFVAESFLIGSAKDNKTVVLEKSPDGLAIYDPGGDELILTNHFQSETFKNSELTLKNKAEGASVYRWDRTRELLDREQKHDELSFVKILRDQNGKGDQSIGMGNEKAINQLIAHHSLVFKPQKLKIWISTFPYQLGDYICYDLKKVFSDTLDIQGEVFSAEDNIDEDPFLSSEAFLNFNIYRQETAKIKTAIDSEQIDGISEEMLHAYLQLNPDYYYPYFLVGEVYRLKGNNQHANELYDASLTKEIPRMVDRKSVIKAKESLMK